MTDTPYSQREHDAFRTNLIGRMDGQDKILTQILEQTKKTNGRVSDLESWKYYMVGFGACFSLIVLPTLFIIIKAVYKI